MATEFTFTGTRGGVVARVWPHERPRYVALLVHGYGEHIGRYEHVAAHLVRHGAAVYGPDHLGHGRSEGERVLIEDFEDVVTDVRAVEERARADHPGVPVVLIGHSMGGLIAARYAQRYGGGLAGLVLSGPVVGAWDVIGVLLAMDDLPDVPIDPATLSRDPAVGAAYAEDPLVWHGPFKRATLLAFARALDKIAEDGSVGELPTLWVHGEDDQLVPLTGSRTGIEILRGADLTERLYPGARHEVLNETNKDEVLAEITAFADRVIVGSGQ
ncbi:lysophospholipase [Nonomuraea sp. NBC_01738]|uniref:alpha/beta hydrolase n=1 Tax=Nonomuraea sp. NBC_01738 TaxID=2976003 RepID=UPI002E0E310B|nr:lysophospholipase [Nonomuraea sp. NBC_01738]